MKLTKSLLLASAAGLAAVATASAADLPSKKAAPVEYVKVCPAFGPGFYYIPGSDTCLKVGGNVYVEGMWAQPYTKAQDTLGYRTQMRITLDARTNTEYGLLRTVVDPRFNKRNGAEQSGSQSREGNSADSLNQLATAKQFQVNTTAYIQFGGLTVGRLGSTFGNQFGFNDLVGSPGYDARDEVIQVSYTASLGNGMTVTAALEDSTDSSRDGIYAVNGSSAATVAAKVPGVNGVSAPTSAGATAPAVTYGGNRIPDAVLSFKIDQSWGSANIAAASHAINYAGASNQFSTEYGYAGQVGVKINLPMIAAGDSIALTGVYASGFNQAVFRNVTGDRQSNDGTGLSGYLPGLYAGNTFNDAVVNLADGQTYQSKAFGGAGEFTHYFTPTLAAFAGGGYARIDWDSAAQRVSAINPGSTYNAYVGMIWSPVKGFKIVPEVEYLKISLKNPVAASGAEPATKSNDAWQARIQVRRDF
jgi:hypothetical protein